MGASISEKCDHCPDRLISREHFRKIRERPPPVYSVLKGRQTLFCQAKTEALEILLNDGSAFLLICSAYMLLLLRYNSLYSEIALVLVL